MRAAARSEGMILDRCFFSGALELYLVADGFVLVLLFAHLFTTASTFVRVVFAAAVLAVFGDVNY